ncbi:MAG: cytochrome c [Verrucomicrobiota bacterium]|jgi:mono/diheme cytochrome c family protein|nr:cytochrome c [Verrucomicrobiota bacterium]
MAAKKQEESMEQTNSNLGGPSPWVYVLMLLLVYWGINYLDGHSGGFNAKVYAPHKNAMTVANLKVQKSAEDLAFEGGARVYRGICAACHQPNGKGSDNAGYPPLAGSEWVLNQSPDRVIAIINNGVQGPLEVAGQTYGKVAMPAQGGALSDEDIANVLSYIRRNSDWGDEHNLSVITAEEVTEVRAKIADRTSPWTAEELMNQFPDSQ